MDFTVEQFLGMFERYNDAIWPMQIVVYGVGLIIVGLLCSRWRHAGRAVLLILAAMWTWLGAVFMLGFQTDISVSGYPFGALFLVGAGLLVVGAVRDGSAIGAGGAPRARTILGGAAIAFALVAYPLVGMAFGHTYPSAPLFGVFPCPTAIFTLGVFLCCTRPRVYELLVPLVWCFFGTMAAVYMGIYQDFGLTATAGLTIVGLGMVRAERCRAGQLPAEQQQGPAQSRPAPKLAAVGR